MTQPPPAKKGRLDKDEAIAANVIVQFESADGTTTGEAARMSAAQGAQPNGGSAPMHAPLLPPSCASPPTNHRTAAGPQLDLPHNVTPAQLEVLLQGLLENEEKQPYSFYIQEQVQSVLAAHEGKRRGAWTPHHAGCATRCSRAKARPAARC